MFKHLRRIAAQNKSGMPGLARSALQSQQRLALMVQRQVAVFAHVRCFSSTAKQRRDLLVPDYAVPDFNATDTTRVTLTTSLLRDKHPTEFATAPRREHEYRLAKNEAIIFNLPQGTTRVQLLDICNGAKGVLVISLNIVESLNSEKPAFAVVKVGTPAQLKGLREALRNCWIKDKKLKLKTQEDLTYETFDNRTIIVQNLPSHIKGHHLIDFFSNFGAVAGVELPTKNLAVEKEIKAKVDSYVKEREEKRVLEIRRAQSLVQESVRENEHYYRQSLARALGSQEEADRLVLQLGGSQPLEEPARSEVAQKLDRQRQLSIQNMLYQLQSESVEVAKARQVLLALRDQASSTATPAIGGAHSEEEGVHSAIGQNKQILRNAIAYVRKNRENVDEGLLERLNSQLLLNNTGDSADPIERLMALSRQELAKAYDSLISVLSQRERGIQRRISSQIEHLGKEERILFERKDWSKELEEVGDFENPFGSNALQAEDIIPIGEQIDNVNAERNMTAEERFTQLATSVFNPFLERNFNPQQIENSQSSELDSDYRVPSKASDPNVAPTINKMLFEGYVFTKDTLESIQAKINSLRGQFDLPFDELYQKEKKLVDAVIRATKALRKKEADLCSPISENRLFTPQELKGNYVGEQYSGETRFQQDQRRRNEALLNAQVDQEGTADYKFQISQTASPPLEQALDSGILTRKEYDEYARWLNEWQEVNFGYAFVTFSHSDEAKLALIAGNQQELENFELQLSIKTPEIDHKDFDLSYQYNKKKNESKLTEELKELREARQELRGFEKDIDSDLPSLKKLRRFRGMAKDVIDGERQHLDNLMQRTQLEEEALKDKIRRLQRENPDRDYTQLFDTERAEIARKAQHKKAFASYKAFQFLKHGVELQSRGKKVATKLPEQPAPYNVNDPYDFPPLNERVNDLMPKNELYPRILDAGDRLDDKPGRRFSYTHDDFLRAYFGKDYSRQPVFNQDDTNLFQVNESLNKRFPIDKYIMGPQIEAKMALLEQRAKLENNSELEEVVNRFDEENEVLEDAPHPTDPSRSYIKDANKRLEAYFKRREKIAADNEQLPLWNVNDVTFIENSLQEEYFPKPKITTKTEEEEEENDSKFDEKFEPFYEGEAAQPPTSSEQSESSPAASDRPNRGGNRPPRHEGYRGAGGRKNKDQQKTPAAAANKVKTKNPLLEEMERDPLVGGNENFDLYTDSHLSQDQKDLNSDFLYDQKFRAQKGQKPAPKSVLHQNIDRIAALNEENSEDFLKSIQNQVYFAEQATNSGPYKLRNKHSVAQGEFDVKTRERALRSLADFAGTPSTGESGELSEREDEDIYQHYMEQMRRENDKKKSSSSRDQSLAEEKLKELQDLHPEMPRFEGFFKSMASQESPFEAHTKDSEDPFKVNEKEEEEYDEELLKRELQGRLLGETLSPRQFELLYNCQTDKNSSVVFQKGADRKQFIDSLDIVRLQDEAKESYRRRQVLSGEWTEEESHGKIKEFIAKQASEMLENQREHEQRIREYKAQREFLKILESDEEGKRMRLEKEYYFDEGLGESLKDHVEDLKRRFPEIDVLVRRDREGYPIVKTQFAPKYKYDIDQAINFNPDEGMQRIKESLEDLYGTVFGIKSLKDLESHEVQGKISQALSSNSDPQYDLDQASKNTFEALWSERLVGKYKNDRAGFVAAFEEAKANASFDTSSPATKFHTPLDSSTVYNQEHAQERELLSYEAFSQMAMRVKQHLYMKERKASDIVVPRRSEHSLFKSQEKSHRNVIGGLETIAEQMKAKQNEKAFDREAYEQIKAEIKLRREAKSRLLQQGFPELKPYISKLFVSI